MEQLLHYCWKHRMWPATGLNTTDGRPVEVLDPGLHNHNAGPDFFNAKVKIGGTLWVGNVEIHDRASHWYQHGHDHDSNYDNVVLHVVGDADRDVQTSQGLYVPQTCLTVPPAVQENYEELLRTDSYPPCYRIIPSLTKTKHSSLSCFLHDGMYGCNSLNYFFTSTFLTAPSADLMKYNPSVRPLKSM